MNLLCFCMGNLLWFSNIPASDKTGKKKNFLLKSKHATIWTFCFERSMQIIHLLDHEKQDSERSHLLNFWKYAEQKK